MRGRPAAVAAALLCVALAGFTAIRYHDRSGPFELWTLHAGMPFATLDAAEYEATKRRFICSTLPGGGRFCQLHGRMAKGMLRLFVDPNGRTAIIQFWPADDNSVYMDNSRKLAAEWTLVATPVSARPDDQPRTSTTLWRTRDRRWSATIQEGCFRQVPTVIEIADDAAVTEYVTANPEARAQMLSVHLLPPAAEVELSDAPRRAPGECAEPIFLRPTP
jgi:hypothetical protein